MSWKGFRRKRPWSNLMFILGQGKQEKESVRTAGFIVRFESRTSRVRSRYGDRLAPTLGGNACCKVQIAVGRPAARRLGRSSSVPWQTDVRRAGLAHRLLRLVALVLLEQQKSTRRSRITYTRKEQHRRTDRQTDRRDVAARVRGEETWKLFII
jgi:hypothetical protein